MYARVPVNRITAFLTVIFSMNFRWLSILVSLCFCSCQSAEDYLHKANLAMEKGEYRKAIGYADKAIAKKKYLSEAYTTKAYCYTALKNDDSAIITYQQVVVFQPSNTLAHYNIAISYFRLNKPDESIAALHGAMRSKGYDPEDSTHIQAIMEKTSTSVLLSGLPDIFDIPFNQIQYLAGQVHYDKGEIRLAYRYFRSCAAAKYNYAESQYMIGLCWLASGKKEKACEAFRTSSFYAYQPAIDELEKHCKSTEPSAFLKQTSSASLN